MKNISKTKSLLFIIAVLLITNIVLLVFYLRSYKTDVDEQKRGPGFTERLRKEVKFDSTQMALYDVKKKAHWKRVRSIFDEITTTKQNFYNLMYDTTVLDSVIVSRAEPIGEQQKALDLRVFRHFQDVRKLCRPDQLPKYDSLLPAIIKRMTEFPGKK